MTAPKTEDPAGGSWHLDKRVPVAFLAAILMQTFTAIWWARGMQEAVIQVGKSLERTDTRIDGIEADRRIERRDQFDINTRVIRIEEKISQQNEYLQRILKSVESPEDERRSRFPGR